MYWNICSVVHSFNRSRLIETWDVLKCPLAIPIAKMSIGLIETWDVLKSMSKKLLKKPVMINRNMRCIEMLERIKWEVANKKINRNMRCIEMILLNVLFCKC